MRFGGNKIFLVLVASQFAGGTAPARIVASWTEEVTRFKGGRSQHLLY
jgi:hypothetical protein